MLEERKTPRFIFVNGMDEEGADLVRVLEQLQDTFGKRIAPFQVPFKENGKFAGFVNVVKMEGRKYVNDRVEACPVPDFLKDEIQPEMCIRDRERGLLSTVHEETILYRITDITLKRSLAHKIFGTGTIVLKVQADANPVQHLVNIKYPEDVRSYLSDLVDEERSSRNVAGREMYGSMGVPHGHGHEGHGGPEYPPPEDAPDIEVPPPPEEF